MINQIDKIRYKFQEIREMQKLIEIEIKEIYDMLSDKKEPKYLSIHDAKNIFGKFEYQEIAGGRIRIIDNWRDENIKLLQVGITKVWIHKLIFPQTAYVFAKIYAEGLGDELDLKGGGGFVPRHQLWNPVYPLSLHSFGVAIDFNPEKYPYGSDKKLHPRVKEIFEEGGFYSGENFKTPDSMHMQFSHWII